MNTLQNQKFMQAGIDYSPRVMMRYLRRARDGTVYFDRQQLVHTEEDESKFFYILNRYYLAGYKDIEDLTVFFESKSGVIIGGAYNLKTGEKTSRRCLISATTKTPYTYAACDIEKFKNIIDNT